MVSNRVVAQHIQDRYYSQKDRDKMPDSDFAGPHQSFPIRTQADVMNAARLVGHADDPAAVKAAIIRIAKRKGFKLPDSWQEEEKPKEATSTPVFTPKQKIATIKTCFLEDDAISLNGRQYPREAVDTLIRSAQVRLSDTHALPITCYLSHDKADQDSTRDLVGKVADVWREGARAYASIDIPDTVAGRDFAALVAGGYIRSQSLRANGAVLSMNKDRAYPQVGGDSLALEGIDCTTRPGLAQTARIEDMVLESHSPQEISEVFGDTTLLLEQQEELSMPETIQEEGIDQQLASGTTVGVTGGDPRDEYSQRMYKMPSGTGNANTSPELGSVHDRIAYVMSLDCGPSTMEAKQRFGDSIVQERKAFKASLKEAGAKLSGGTKAHLMKAHDGVAKHLGMECADNASGNDGMQDGDDDDMHGKESAPAPSLTKQDILDTLREAGIMPAPQQQQEVKETQEDMTMNPEEAARLLEAAGYKIEAPKSAEDLLQERLAAQEQQMAEQRQQFDELKALLSQKFAAPAQVFAQRKSLVEGSNATEQPKRPYYRNGDYMRERLRDSDLRQQLLDRSRPLPEDMNIEHMLRELQLEYLGMYDERFGLDGAPKSVW